MMKRVYLSFFIVSIFTTNLYSDSNNSQIDSISYYFPKVLDAPRLYAAWSLSPREYIRQLYPDIPYIREVSFIDQCKAQWHKIASFISLIRKHAGIIIKNPRYGIWQVWQRIRG